MFNKVAADVLGLSDVGSVIHPRDFDKVDSDDYVMHEDNEKIFFLIKSKADEYCFTNKGLIHLDGKSAMSKKRTLRRYNFNTHKISNVSLETAGTVDLDVEIKFSFGNEHFTIDVHKKHIEQLKDLYKALLKISEIVAENEYSLHHSRESLNVASKLVEGLRGTDGNVVDQFKEVNAVAFEWLEENRKKYNVKNFGPVFERYINN